MKKKLFFAALAAAATLFTVSCGKEDAENVVAINFSDLTLAADSYWNGSDNSGKFTSGIAEFSNSFTDWGGGFISWNGFAYSNKNDTATADYTNEFSVYTTSANTNGIFAVCYISDYENDTAPTITFDEPVALKKVDLALNTYAYKSMKYGDEVSKKFTAGDWYKITISGYAQDGTQTAELDVYLADFRNGKSVLVSGWTSVDLSPLGSVSKLTFAASSSDVGEYGINTPTYFCMDNIMYVK